MCGICGSWGARDSRAALSEVSDMMAAIVHRGPDSGGQLHREGATIGMRRLRIIDLAGGEQPIFNEDRSVAVVFNGEIYNFKALRDELQKAGHRFTTRSDTEVLVHGYEAWGDELPTRLRGMFAFAVLDDRRHRLLLCRDRFGKKPLYWSAVGDELRFASEIKALLAAGVSAELDEQALAAYLRLRYVPAPATMFREVSQLPAGHMMVVDEAGVDVRRWWRLAYEPKREVGIEEAEREVEDRLREAVELRLVSDVPLGCFLSGGLDSSLVLSFMAEAGDGPVRTFSIGFQEGWASDELPAARATARTFGARHSESRLGPEEFLDLLPQAVWHRDEPLAEPSEIPLLALSRRASEDVTVVLSGEGGDELFGGYPKYRVDAAVARAARLGAPVFRSRAWRGIANAPRIPRRARLALHTLAMTDPAERWPAWFGADQSAMLGGDGQNPLETLFRSLDGRLRRLDAMLALDVESYLVDNLLVRGDKMTMAASIEGRMPLLDHSLAELVARFPPEMKAVPRETKVLLRRIARRRLPPELLDRPKIGFAVPIRSWFRRELGDVAEDRLLAPEARRRGLVDPEIVTRLIGEHRSGRYDLGKELWSLLNLEVWARVFLDGVPPEDLRMSGRKPQMFGSR